RRPAQHLDRDLALELRVVRAIHRAHRAAAELGDDLESLDAPARHARRWYRGCWPEPGQLEPGAPPRIPSIVASLRDGALGPAVAGWTGTEGEPRCAPASRSSCPP